VVKEHIFVADLFATEISAVLIKSQTIRTIKYVHFEQKDVKIIDKSEKIHYL
jgi:hypothetical protein